MKDPYDAFIDKYVHYPTDQYERVMSKSFLKSILKKLAETIKKQYEQKNKTT